jgi:hypothetical protein
MQTPSFRAKLFRLAFGSAFTALGLWASARMVLQLQAVSAPWPDWLALLFPAVPLAMGIFALLAAWRNYPDVRRPFLRHRSGPARIFGGIFGATYLFSILITHLFRQNSLGGVMRELIIAALAAGLLALIYGAVNADLGTQEKQRIGK